MKKSTVYLLEVADGSLWQGIAAYRNEADADKAWRENTIDSIFLEVHARKETPPARVVLENMDDQELAALAEEYSDAGFYSVEVIEFYE